jgi:alkylated DNA repair dioxygenase AlkB
MRPIKKHRSVLCFRRVKQEELFHGISELQSPNVPGFLLQPGYITLEEETELLDKVDAHEWDTDWKRRVQRYGALYGTAKEPEVAAPLPEWLDALAMKVAKDADFDRYPENCVINEYQPGQGIAPHKDYPSFGRTVACVSLGSGVVLDFHTEDRETKRSIFIPARSLWIISGDARTNWLHGIAPRLFDTVHGEKRKRERRVSITFRLKKDRPE